MSLSLERSQKRQEPRRLRAWRSSADSERLMCWVVERMVLRQRLDAGIGSLDRPAQGLVELLQVLQVQLDGVPGSPGRPGAGCGGPLGGCSD